MVKLVFQIGGSLLGLWLASQFVLGVQIIEEPQTFLVLGTILGLANVFLKPVLKAITFPLRFITLGLFNLVINMGIIWGLDFFFASLTIEGLVPLFLTSIIVFGIISLTT